MSRTPRPPTDRVLDLVEIARPTECWIWMGTLVGGGYGQITVGSRTDGTRGRARTHVVVYEHFVGRIPDGLELDHLCKVKACCCPWHLEAVTHAENVRRGNVGAHNRRKTHCPKGHPYDEANTLVSGERRNCRTCKRERERERRARNGF